MLSNLDYTMFQWINHLAVSERVFNPLMVLLAEKAEYLFMAGILFYWFFQKTKNRRMVVEACFSACLALGINVLIGMFFYRDRPFVSHHVHWLIHHARNASFPSDHATAAFVIAASIWIWSKRDGWIWLLLAAGISLSRVWTGVHYPLDVISGMVIGVGSAFLVHYVFARFTIFNRLGEFVIGLYDRAENIVLRRS
ncbi:undecaprenyl-diphosphatase [Bacillus sp. FJAT-29953]|nr:undecaprenyl-diphosphatase [Bacillus sp. FJAT-29953]